MPTLKNVVAVDWLAGKDKIFFFFKDSNTYSRFDISEDRVPDGYPALIKHSNWHDFYLHAQQLRFGLSTTNFKEEPGAGFDQDVLWLFHHDSSSAQPMVCKYNQDTDKVIRTYPLNASPWYNLAPYFDRIVAGAWWPSNSNFSRFRFLMNDGNSLFLNFDQGVYPTFNKQPPKVTVEPITNITWPGLEPYKNRIITAAKRDRTFDDNYLYIFLTENKYITYNMGQNKVEYGPHSVDDLTWPGLLRD